MADTFSREVPTGNQELPPGLHGGVSQHPHRPRLLARPPPRLRLCPAPGAQEVLPVGPGDQPACPRGNLTHGPAGAVQAVEGLVNGREVAHRLNGPSSPDILVAGVDLLVAMAWWQRTHGGSLRPWGLSGIGDFAGLSGIGGGGKRWFA